MVVVVVVVAHRWLIQGIYTTHFSFCVVREAVCLLLEHEGAKAVGQERHGRSRHNKETKNLAKKKRPPPQKRIQHGLWVLPGFCCFFAVYIHTYIQPAYSNSFFLSTLPTTTRTASMLHFRLVLYITLRSNQCRGWMDGSGGIWGFWDFRIFGGFLKPCSM